jgi:hypothetical protein
MKCWYRNWNRQDAKTKVVLKNHTEQRMKCWYRITQMNKQTDSHCGPPKKQNALVCIVTCSWTLSVGNPGHGASSLRRKNTHVCRRCNACNQHRCWQVGSDHFCLKFHVSSYEVEWCLQQIPLFILLRVSAPSPALPSQRLYSRLFVSQFIQHHQSRMREIE